MARKKGKKGRSVTREVERAKERISSRHKNRYVGESSEGERGVGC
jgi:hypothetical protein